MDNRRLSFENFERLWNLIHDSGEFTIKNVGDELELHYPSTLNADILAEVDRIISISNKGNSFFSFKKKQDDRYFTAFKDQKSLFGAINSNMDFLSSHDLFVLDYNGSYLYYDAISQKVKSNSTFLYYESLIKHHSAYSKLLRIFKANTPKLIEFDKGTENELVVLSKGTENFITKIKYKEIDDSIFGSDYIEKPIEELELKLINEEWVASFKSALCDYMELQSDAQRTFATVYNNLTYILNQTNKNYELFVSKFSFDKVKKQFKTEKAAYFDALSKAQDKISSQIVSIPISLGAAILSFYKLTDFTTIVLIYFAIIIYVFFIVFVVAGYLVDINKLAKDVNDEKNNLERHYQMLAKEFESEFNFMRQKRRFIRFLGFAIIVALGLTLITLTYYVFSAEIHAPSIFKFIADFKTTIVGYQI